MLKPPKPEIASADEWLQVRIYLGIYLVTFTTWWPSRLGVAYQCFQGHVPPTVPALAQGRWQCVPFPCELDYISRVSSMWNGKDSDSHSHWKLCSGLSGTWLCLDQAKLQKPPITEVTLLTSRQTRNPLVMGSMRSSGTSNRYQLFPTSLHATMEYIRTDNKSGFLSALFLAVDPDHGSHGWTGGLRLQSAAILEPSHGQTVPHRSILVLLCLKQCACRGNTEAEGIPVSHTSINLLRT